MRTEKQIEASCANGAKSMGPITPEGQARSSQNAYIHGLTALIGFKAEGRSELALLAQDYLDQHQPVGQAETHCVEILVACHWRQNRSWSLEATRHMCAPGKPPHPALDNSTSRYPPCCRTRVLSPAEQIMAPTVTAPSAPVKDKATWIPGTGKIQPCKLVSRLPDKEQRRHIPRQRPFQWINVILVEWDAHGETQPAVESEIPAKDLRFRGADAVVAFPHANGSSPTWT